MKKLLRIYCLLRKIGENMSAWKELFMIKSLLGRKTDLVKEEEVIQKCAELAYKDMLTAGRYYLYKKDDNKASKKEEQHQKMVGHCKELIDLLEKNNYVFSRKIIQEACLFFGQQEIIGQENKYVTRFGLAQKFVNMMFKYLYIFSDYTGKEIDFSSCDCPLDSVILQKISKIEHVWSKISEKEYIICQQNIEKDLKEMQLDDELKILGNLAFDFKMW